MKILYYDCFSGISGDMNLGAMIDLGVDENYLLKELSKLNIDKEYNIKIRRDTRKGISGTKVDVILNPHNNEEHHHHHEERYYEEAHHHGEVHHYHEDHHHHGEEHNHDLGHHHHRNLEDIENIINSSNLSDNVKKISLDMFLNVAKAESKVHGKPLYEVHFHEVGAVDSIVDIVGAAICLDYLKVDKIMASSVELGGGFVKCAHGLIPVPAPATVEILKTVPIKAGAVSFETTTPTGAAILKSSVHEFTDIKDFIIDKVGYGIGNRDTDIPNVLRVYLGEENKKINKKSVCEDEVNVLECNIDDMNPEVYNYVMEKLFENGALDVYRVPLCMKKDRLGVMLGVLCKDIDKPVLEDIIFKETTTIGIREHKVNRAKLNREFSIVETSYGHVKLKNSYLRGKKIKSKPEYEDCRRLAKENKVPINKIYEEVLKYCLQNVEE